MSYGLDISQFTPGAMGGPITDDMIARCLARGIDRFIVSILDQNIARQQIAVLSRHPIEIQTYRAYEWASMRESQADDVAFIAEVRKTYNLQKHWIDVESGARTRIDANIADIDWLIKSFTGVCPTGIYTSPGWWQQYTGNTTQFAYMPFWVAHWNGKDSLTDFSHFGGITSCEMHQTLNDLFVEDIWCDTNYYERATPPPPPEPGPPPLAAKLEHVSTQILDKGDGLFTVETNVKVTL